MIRGSPLTTFLLVMVVGVLLGAASCYAKPHPRRHQPQRDQERDQDTHENKKGGKEDERANIIYDDVMSTWMEEVKREDEVEREREREEIETREIETGETDDKERDDDPIDSMYTLYKTSKKVGGWLSSLRKGVYERFVSTTNAPAEGSSHIEGKRRYKRDNWQYSDSYNHDETFSLFIVVLLLAVGLIFVFACVYCYLMSSFARIIGTISALLTFIVILHRIYAVSEEFYPNNNGGGDEMRNMMEHYPF
jgi:hypothetical protein